MTRCDGLIQRFAENSRGGAENEKAISVRPARHRERLLDTQDLRVSGNDIAKAPSAHGGVERFPVKAPPLRGTATRAPAAPRRNSRTGADATREPSV